MDNIRAFNGPSYTRDQFEELVFSSGWVDLTTVRGKDGKMEYKLILDGEFTLAAISAIQVAVRDNPEWFDHS